jgi:hypothetical protein
MTRIVNQPNCLVAIIAIGTIVVSVRDGNVPSRRLHFFSVGSGTGMEALEAFIKQGIVPGK